MLSPASSSALGSRSLVAIESGSAVKASVERGGLAASAMGPEIRSGEIAVVFLSLLGFVGTVECLVAPCRRGEVGGLGGFDPEELPDMVDGVSRWCYKNSIPKGLPIDGSTKSRLREGACNSETLAMSGRKSRPSPQCLRVPIVKLQKVMRSRASDEKRQLHTTYLTSKQYDTRAPRGKRDAPEA